jgi:hypothetical protein
LWNEHILLLLLLQSALQLLVGFRPAQLPLSILSRKVLQIVVASGTSNPNLEENQGFRTVQLSPSVWSDASEPSSGKWNYGREKAEKFCRKWRLPRHFWVLLHAVKHDRNKHISNIKLKENLFKTDLSYFRVLL